jgi:hypothetical protein
MKTFSILWSFVLASLIFTSCAQEDLATPSTKGNSDILAAKKSDRETGIVTYSGQATGLNATIMTQQNGGIVSHQTILAQTGFLPASGGNLSANYAQANIEGVLTAETLNASTSGQGNQTTSQASATFLNVTIAGNVISADYVSATATATCGATSGSSQIQNLVVNGTPVVVTGATNQAIYLSNGGFILINEQSKSKGKAKNITVSALHIIMPNAGDIRVATARAEIKC